MSNCRMYTEAEITKVSEKKNRSDENIKRRGRTEIISSTLYDESLASTDYLTWRT
jgi:hypothetical protein